MGKLSRYWNRWVALSVFGKLTFLKAVAVLLVVKTGLTFLPFGTFRKIFAWFSRPSGISGYSDAQIDEVVWSVKTAANLLPVTLLCLPRALAAKYLLKNEASLTLQIGVEINSQKAFEAHAWVEKNGLIIIGDWPESVSYHRLWAWE
ncbi:hypothetical protein DYBT9275_00859 [Dyadobacter sp. CECT 9275]|uniref:Microcin J25-processing protein McjB C-terminal domain-containing protein n=1 Tax=Dyadobacter helix TaxID=2822344 RepID=A0A916J890_9BACT|nr:lasso peptide biosynthesis B2 protein [Dyadobacter sp. CECT 9275]CAG4991938.1 hypothetical protein DYBT9275_00859 [Dyadobacter sp. CECT 9275]